MARDLNAPSIPSDYTTYNINTGTVTQPRSMTWSQAISEQINNSKIKWGSAVDSLFIQKVNQMDNEALNAYLRTSLGYVGKDVQSYRDIFSASKFNFQAPAYGGESTFGEMKMGLGFFDNLIRDVNQFKASSKFSTYKALNLADKLAKETPGRESTILGSPGSAQSILGSPITQNKTLIGG